MFAKTLTTRNCPDPKAIKDELLSFLLAGRDTTSCLLTYVTYVMAMYPDIARKMRAEVLHHCQHSPPTFAGTKELRYGEHIRHRPTLSSDVRPATVHAVINETLRLFPPVPLNIRETREEGVVLPPSDPTYPSASEPIYLPEQTTVTYLPLLVHKNKALWGDDADVFDPERWLDDRLKLYTDNPMMYTPFSAGPRIVSLVAFPTNWRLGLNASGSVWARTMRGTRRRISSSGSCSSSTRSRWRQRRSPRARCRLSTGETVWAVRRSRRYGLRTP